MLRSLILISVRSPFLSMQLQANRLTKGKGCPTDDRPTAERDETLSEAIGHRRSPQTCGGGGGGGGAKEAKP